ncbi:MAG TPA: rhodanese-like domain-containing protein [Flavipsychrobacter sp.]|jgi:adenylyltransferase/sulfurtransferase|nr:rhodanese-like domain-containing protein [Flavipsychrobacter sp.]
MKEISLDQINQWIQEQRVFQLIDVRTAGERAQYQIGGENIPFDELMQRKSEINTDRPVILYCEKGIRSLLIIQRLEALGYSNLYNLKHGIKPYAEKLLK